MRAVLYTTVVLVLLVCGCRGIWHRNVPELGLLPDAHHLKFDQLEFHCDFDLKRDDPLVRELIAEREDIHQTLGLPANDRIVDVYLFRDAEAYGSFLARHFPSLPTRRAFFLETDTRLAVYAHSSDRVAEDLRHEVAHGYLHAAVPGIPLWLDEGLAEFFEVPRNQNGLNRPHLDLLSDMMRLESWRPKLERLELLAEASQLQQLDYAESWAWVYFLLHSDPERRELFLSYLNDLQSDQAADPLSQWLVQHGVQPESVLGDYLAGLQQGTKLR